MRPWEATGGYRLAAGSELPPMLFDDDQTVAIAVALQAATVAGAEIGEGAIRALATVRSARGGISVEVLLSMATTMRAREVLRFDYAPRIAPADDSFPPPRRVEPHHLLTAHGRWHLVAWDP